jgi:hypothetical protein
MSSAIKAKLVKKMSVGSEWPAYFKQFVNRLVFPKLA